MCRGYWTVLRLCVSTLQHNLVKDTKQLNENKITEQGERWGEMEQMRTEQQSKHGKSTQVQQQIIKKQKEICK